MYFDRILKAFSTVLDEQDANNLTEESSIDDVSSWDSLNFIALVMAIENEFHIQLSTLDAASLTSIMAIEKYLQEKIKS